MATARPTPVPAPVTSANFADALIGFPSLGHDPEKWEPVFGKGHAQTE
jgi:hypothetical protein